MRKYKQIKRKEVIFELDEWRYIEQAAEKIGITTSDYIRRMALNGKVTQIEMNNVTPLVNGMRTISNNINQIARKANETHSIHNDDVNRMKIEVESLCRLLSQALSELRSIAA